MNPLTDQLIAFVFELVQLRRVKREGWRMVGVDNPESIAEHSLRAAQIAFILAKLERYPNPEEVCSMVVFHDIQECRIGDIHKVANRYLTHNDPLVVEEQMKELGEIGLSISNLWKQTEEKSTQAGIIAKDADLLEAAFTAREYKERGVPLMDLWMKNYMQYLNTGSAKHLLEELLKTESVWWWKDLKKY
jgi:putative hydrolases of HD superfamily